MSNSVSADGGAGATARPGHARGSSLSDGINNITSPSGPRGPEDPAVAGIADALSASGNPSQDAAVTPAAKGKAKSQSKKKGKMVIDDGVDRSSKGLLRDLITFRWMTVPASSFKIAFTLAAVYLTLEFVPGFSGTNNPLAPLVRISHRVPLTSVLAAEPSLIGEALTAPIHSGVSPTEAPSTIRYQKGYQDLAFVAYYIVVFSFIRQASTQYLFRPFALWWGIRNERKLERFVEQGYAMLYWGTAGALGLYVMSFQESWWYNLEHLWLKYPHWQMRPELKAYYLLQLSYWLQQALVMILRLEAPRKDYYELIVHHLVTLWLIFWSYLINLTMIGTTVFVAMDVPDTFLALSKALSYMGIEAITMPVFAIFMVVWTYFRIYESARTLWSVWFQFDLIPEHTKEWNPPQGWWMVWWMKYQVFAPLFILLCLNLFWYFLMWRIMIRALAGGPAEDEREEGEYEEEEAEKEKAKSK
ncbi:Protein transporter of the TRAM (translocating chain-associating membrane) superfamily [Ceraceosorus bombacis]|uniref:Protein transporter of the TRAM (Translocating chain-associating membrane) superfamily n=1 Tax=Ceraceosorus bombacis TaxID=401625 RepID=A0A0P1BMB7_9BASI|nr:Protein transporter of the TRAM (translocating chain-associating membrane) superfamily [Ceraceosorus bombacis]